MFKDDLLPSEIGKYAPIGKGMRLEGSVSVLAGEEREERGLHRYSPLLLLSLQDFHCAEGTKITECELVRQPRCGTNPPGYFYSALLNTPLILRQSLL